MISRYFQFESRRTTLRQEIMAGITTFLTMAYIIFVNPSILSEAGMDRDALIVVTCLIAAVSTLLMGLIPNVPIAMAPGMGMNAFFTYTLVQTYGMSWQAALGIVFWAGSLFLFLSLIGAREKILQAIPQSLISAIAAGIGLFILFIGMKNMGLIVGNTATLVSLGSFTVEVILGIVGLFVSIVLLVRGIQAAILIGILVTTAFAMALGKVEFPTQMFSYDLSISAISFQLDLWSAFKWSLIGPIFALMFIDLFDTLGTLVACAHEAKLVEKDGKINKLSSMLNIDAIATMLSGLLGSSPTTSYVESASGIAAGGKTGFTSVITGSLFLVALLFIPLIGIVPPYATAPALIIVGMMMLKSVRNIQFESYEESFPALLTITTMVFSFQISTGLAIGFLSWGIIKLFLLKVKDISWVMWIIMVLSGLSLVV
ncbi:MAG: NCS2 family permease [Bacteroidota bacterium]